MNTVHTCGIKINPIPTEEVLQYVEDCFAKNKKGIQITGVNIEQFALLDKDKNFKDYVNSSDIVNIDGMSNRVAAIAFGPKQVIMIVGINKIAKDVDAAIKRARGTAAPINAQRFPMKNMPCRFDGVCHNCTSEDCICCNISIIRSSMIPNRIKVIIVDEEMGF